MSVSRKPVFDAALAAAVKAQEKKTGEKAPYFGAETQREALELDAWKDIGMVWGDRAPVTCFDAYVERYPVGRKCIYTATAKDEVLRGDLDDVIIRAAAVCHDAARDIYNHAHKYVDRDVPAKEVRERLKALNYTVQRTVWLAELRDEIEAAKSELVGRTITYDADASTHKVVDVGFLDTGTVLHAFCVADEKGKEFEAGDEWECSLDHARIWAAGGVVDEPEEMSEEDEEEPPAVPDPPKPPPPPRTRDGKRAAAASAARALGAKKACAFNSKRARRDKAADAAAAQDDVEEDDGAFRGYVPPHELIEGDKRPTTVDDDALRATIGDASLLDEAKVETRLGRRLAPMEMRAPPKNALRERPRVLPRIGEVCWAIEGDPGLTKMCRAVAILTGEIESACGGSGRRGDPTNHAADVFLEKTRRRVKVKNNRNGAGGLHLVGPNDGTSSDTSRDFLSYVKGLAAKASGADKAALEFFAAQCERWLFARTILAELATYPAGSQGNEHRDDEEPDLTNQHDHRNRGGEAKGFRFAGPVKLRLALSVRGRRSMSFYDTRGWVATIDRSPGRGVCFVDGAHTRSRGVVEHRNDAGDEPGATLILTFRADASHAFDNLSPAERLFAHAGIALFAAD